MKLSIASLVVMLAATVGLAASSGHGEGAAAGHGAAHGAVAAGHGEVVPGPVISSNASWTSSMVIVVVAMFVAAMVIGPIYRASLPEEPPQPDAHDDHSHGGGHGHDDAHGHGAAHH